MFTNFHAAYQPSQSQSGLPGISNYQTSQPHGPDLIGQAIPFAHGQFSGLTIRAELREVQQAQLGRKYARVDRRPLDPPPVILLNLYKIYHAGTDQELEKEFHSYETVQLLGLICTVDLFPLPSSETKRHSKESKRRARTSEPVQQTLFPSSSDFSASSSRDPRCAQTLVFPPHQSYSSSPTFSDPTMASPSQSTSSSLSPGYGHQCISMVPSIPDHDPDIVQYIGDHPIRESSNMTTSLVGATFVQPSLVDYQGRKSILFVFADLAVKTEGTFFLRYRFFDIFSRPCNHPDLAVQAECYGGPFRVYSTKEFPGLQASTDLTKQLARWGVRLNTRETERRRRKKGEARSSSPENRTDKKRRRRNSEDADDVDD